MKTRFNSFDITCGVAELQRLVGLRVNQIYDIDNKTYLFRLQGSGEDKNVLLIESGTRFHTTAFEWQKNMAPSGFSMKLRKHLKNKRLEKFQQLGADRIVDFQFGAGEAAYHVILELYDRGNIILTDHDLTILYILRPHTEGEQIRFAVREKYPTNRAKSANQELSEDEIRKCIESSRGQNLRRILMPMMDCGPAVIDHVLKKHGLENRSVPQTNLDENPVDGNVSKKKGKRANKEKNVVYEEFNMERDFPLLMQAIKDANDLLVLASVEVPKGYIVQAIEEKPIESTDGTETDADKYFYRNVEYHPYLFEQFKNDPVAKFDTFMLAVDEFYSKLEAQKIDLKTLQQERDALKKLSNVKKDHAKRLEDLNKVQEVDVKKAELITSNQELVDKAIFAVQSAIASQLSWTDIKELVKEAQSNGDPVASCIKQLKLEINHVSLSLQNPYEDDDDDGESETSGPQIVDIDLALSAWANARRYYDQKRSAAQKEQKTIDASQKALKSAEKKTQQTLKEVRTISSIVKARKVYWFEKFYWFISSENYLVVGGRDAQQNELIVKRYMRPADIYVHAEIQGASSVIIRNPTGEEIPPKTLLEAGTMAISYSVAWDAKVVTNAYWVKSDQVSKTAPSGEYLGTGSFMIRGKKNFLPSCHLIMGLSLLFKLEDSFIEKHLGERKVRGVDELGEAEKQINELTIEKDVLSDIDEDVDVDADNDNEQDLKESSDDLENAKDSKFDFPDTQVKIEHDTGRITIRSDSIETATDEAIGTSTSSILLKKAETMEETTIIQAAPARKKQQLNSKKRKEEKERKTQEHLQKQQQNAAVNNEDRAKNNNQKRGQKGKLKKIKQKYKDQDDEERELRMRIINASGKDTKTNDLKTVEQQSESENNSNVGQSFPQSKKPQQQNNKTTTDGDDIDDVPVGADVEMINSLTGTPFEGDELLFAIPVVAPYQSLQNYKFKAKLTPGTTKRGKVAKLALAIFAKDKNCNAREKDLLKSIKDEALARNIPGKVKLSAPQLTKLKK